MTLDEARDEIYAVFKAAWDDTGYTAIYPDVTADVPEVGAWARVTLNHADGMQTTLGGIGARKFTMTGFLTVQVFTPRGDGNALGYRLGRVLLQAFSNASGSVWYRNPRIKEVPGGSGAFSQINFLVDFQYDDTR